MELSWLSYEDFNEKVKEIWIQPVVGQNSVQRWNRKMGALRKHLRVWARHHHGVYKAQKENLQKVVTNLDTQADIINLSQGERDQLETARDDLIKLLWEEELRFYQRAKATDVLLGDNNTRYFQMIANGKHRKKHIFSLEHEGGGYRGSTKPQRV